MPQPIRYRTYYICKKCHIRRKRRDGFCKRCGPPRASGPLRRRKSRTYKNAAAERSKLIRDQYRQVKVPYDEESSFDSDESLPAFPSVSSSSDSDFFSLRSARRHLPDESENEGRDGAGLPHDFEQVQSDSENEHGDVAGMPRDFAIEQVHNDPENERGDGAGMPHAFAIEQLQTDSENDEGIIPGNADANPAEGGNQRAACHGPDEEMDDEEPKPGPSGFKNQYKLKFSEKTQFVERAFKKTISFPEEEIENTAENLYFTTDISFSALSEAVSHSTLEAIKEMGYSKMTKTQATLIPRLLEGQDIIYPSKPLSGKTLAFLVPAIELVAKRELSQGKGTEVIIITATRNLATHTWDFLKNLLKYHHSITYGLVMGGSNRQVETESLKNDVNILVATPGRLLYHLNNTPGLLFESLKCLIIDKADSRDNADFEELVEKITSILPKKGQTVIFSAVPDSD